MERFAALYIRVSTDAQAEEGYSIDAQREALQAYCVAMSIPQNKLYVDPGFSGSNIDRPALREMIRDIYNKKIDRVLVYKLDRLSRSQKDTLYLIEDVFSPNSVEFISMRESFDTSTPMGKASLGLMSVFAQLERETIRERTQMGMKERVRNGFWMGGARTPFGYDYVPAENTLIPNSDANIVQRCYELYLDGEPPESIARMFNFKSDVQVRNLLSKKTYLGLIPYKGEFYPGRHKPLVSTDLFEMVQAAKQNRSKVIERNTDYLLTGLVVCGECGAKMRYIKWGGTSVKLRCYSVFNRPHLIKDANCPSVTHESSDVEEAVLRALKNRSLEIRNGSMQAAISPVEAIRQQIAAEEKKLKRLYALYADGDDGLLDVISEKRASISVLDDELEKATRKDDATRQISLLYENLSRFDTTWDKLTKKHRRLLIIDLVEKVVLKDGDIEVHFRV